MFHSPILSHTNPPNSDAPCTLLVQRHRVCVKHYKAENFYMEPGGPLCRFCQQVGAGRSCLWVLGAAVCGCWGRLTQAGKHQFNMPRFCQQAGAAPAGPKAAAFPADFSFALLRLPPLRRCTQQA